MANKIKAEIFKAGTWHPSNSPKPITFSEEDLQKIVAGFNAMKEEFGVPLKLGHDVEQPLTDGLPSIGWVESVWLEGKSLMANFMDVPDVVFDAIKNKLYRTVSVEMDRGVKYEGKEYSWALSAVALLGATLPAVSGLADLNAFMSRLRPAQGELMAFKAIQFSTKEEHKMDDDNVTKKDLSEIMDKVKAQGEQFSKVEAENVALKKDKEDREKAEFTANATSKRKEVTTILDDAVKDKRILPAQRESFAKAIGLDDDARIGSVDLDQVKAFAQSVEPKKDDKEQGRTEGEGDELEAPQALMKEVRKLQRESLTAGKKLDFTTAMKEVMVDSPELAKSWVNYNNGTEAKQA